MVCLCVYVCYLATGWRSHETTPHPFQEPLIHSKCISHHTSGLRDTHLQPPVSGAVAQAHPLVAAVGQFHGFTGGLEDDTKGIQGVGRPA